MAEGFELQRVNLQMKLLRLGWLYKVQYVCAAPGLQDKWTTLAEDAVPRLDPPGTWSGDAVELLRMAVGELPRLSRPK